MGLRVVELFAGVGGFRLGLSDAGHEIVWWNQWEPSSKKHQHAFDCYARKFHGEENVHVLHNTDIQQVDLNRIPAHDLVVGGFPCQDYSVAAPLRHSKGLEGKKGVLWWRINDIVEHHLPRFLLLENVDRLLTSPKTQRGRDFGVLLSCLHRLGYNAEWRVINAADYSEPQRRRRIFIYAARRDTRAGEFMHRHAADQDYLTTRGFFAKPFPVVQEATPPSDQRYPDGHVSKDPPSISSSFTFEFRNAGVMVDGELRTSRVEAIRESPSAKMRSCLEKGASKEYYVPRKLVKEWRAAKKAKEIPKVSREGVKYIYKEGSIPFPDPVTESARTLLTGEGSVNPSRSNHIIRDPWTKRYRILTPRECERLMGFPPDWTKGMPHRWRYFTMGNALVVGMVRRMGHRLEEFASSPASSAPTAKESPRRAATKPRRR